MPYETLRHEPWFRASRGYMKVCWVVVVVLWLWWQGRVAGCFRDNSTSNILVVELQKVLVVGS